MYSIGWSLLYPPFSTPVPLFSGESARDPSLRSEPTLECSEGITAWGCVILSLRSEPTLERSEGMTAWGCVILSLRSEPALERSEGMTAWGCVILSAAKDLWRASVQQT